MCRQYVKSFRQGFFEFTSPAARFFDLWGTLHTLHLNKLTVHFSSAFHAKVLEDQDVVGIFQVIPKSPIPRRG